MEQLLQDIRFGIRQLVKHPGFTLVATLALGLGIGSVTTQLSVVKGLFFSSLPFEKAGEIFHMERINLERATYDAEVPIYEFLEWQRNQNAFEELSAYYSGTANLTLGAEVNRYDGCFISANAFQQLGIQAFMGRPLEPADDLPEAAGVVVLSHKIWKNDLGADPDIIGKSAILNGRTVTIVGIMEPDFGFPVNEDLWVPLFQQQKPSTISWGQDIITLEVFGRMRKGLGMDQAKASMAVLAANLEDRHPETNRGFRDVHIQPFTAEYVGRDEASLSSVMMLITFLILMIAAANVANLLLARSVRRQKEVAIRSALGATRNRIIYQFLVESILLSVVGAILGVLLANFQLNEIIRMTVEMDAPFWMDFHLDWKVMLLVTILTIATGVASGLVPAIRASRCNDCEILKDDTRTGSSMRMGNFSKSLVVVQISLAAIILTLVMLFTGSVRNALNLQYEYDADGIMTARMGLFEEVYPDEQSRATFVNSLLLRLRANPAVEWASTSNRYGFLGTPWIPYEMPGDAYAGDDQRKRVRCQQVSSDFFKTTRLQVLAGRDFNPEDFTAGQPRFAIINKAFAEREWPGQNPLGKRFRLQLQGLNPDQDEFPLLEVIGIAGNMNEKGVLAEPNDDGAACFVPQVGALMPNFVTILARGRGEPVDLLPIIREEVARLDRNLPLYTTGTPRELNDQQLTQFRFFGNVFTSFGIIATFLASIGIYGVITFSVNQRITEFGIRQALGATRKAVFRLVYRHAFKQLALGFLIAFACLTPLMFSTGLRESMTLFFYGTDPDSMLPYLVSFSFVAIISLLSAAPPAFRAARTEPAQALRYE